MINIALLTGRGGSNLKDKNIRIVRGKPVLAYPCMAANRSELFTHLYCSSDDSKILDAALDYGFKRLVRPDKLAEADSRHVDVLNHALAKFLENDLCPDILTVLMANSATISSDQLLNAFNLIMSDENISSVVPVIVNQDHHPFRARRVKDGRLVSYFDGLSNLSSNRQELPQNFFMTHSFWMIRLSNGALPLSDSATPWEFMGPNIKPLVIDYSVDIHDLEDLALTEKWLADNHSSQG